MNKNEELCKIFEIKPHFSLKYKIGDDSFEIFGSEKAVDDEFNYLLKSSPINGKDVKLIGKTEIFVNFELPENFLNLLDCILKAQKPPMDFIILNGSDIIEAINEKITRYIEFYKDNKGQLHNVQEMAQQVKWNYQDEQ